MIKIIAQPNKRQNLFLMNNKPSIPCKLNKKKNQSLLLSFNTLLAILALMIVQCNKFSVITSLINTECNKFSQIPHLHPTKVINLTFCYLPVTIVSKKDPNSMLKLHIAKALYTNPIIMIAGSTTSTRNRYIHFGLWNKLNTIITNNNTKSL